MKYSLFNVLEEAFAVGGSKYLRALHEAPTIVDWIKYSQLDSAPTPHGLRITLADGQAFEISIRKVA